MLCPLGRLNSKQCKQNNSKIEYRKLSRATRHYRVPFRSVMHLPEALTLPLMRYYAPPNWEHRSKNSLHLPHKESQIMCSLPRLSPGITVLTARRLYLLYQTAHPLIRMAIMAYFGIGNILPLHVFFNKYVLLHVRYRLSFELRIRSQRPVRHI